MHAGSVHYRAFTLVELLVVMGIMLLLTVMTIGAINLSITSERVRGGARQVQSLIEGARDRAIYAREPRGIRILVNEEITEDHDGDAATGSPPTPEIPTVATTIVYIGSPGQDTSQEDRDDVNGNGIVDELRTYVQMVNPSIADGPPLGWAPDDPRRRAVIGVNTNWTTLYERGLIGPGSSIVIEGCEYPIDPVSFPIRREVEPYNATPPPGGSYGGFGGNVNGDNPFQPNPTPPPPFGAPTPPPGDEILYVLWDDDCFPAPTGGSITFPYDTERLAYSIQLNPDVLPGEEPSVLPRNVCIDLETSHLPEGWITFNATTGRQFSSRMDILYSPSGAIIGDAGAAGLIHLHVSHVADAIANVPPGSQTLDGTVGGEPRNGDEFGVTIFTRAGRVITHPIDWAGYPVPATEFRNLAFTDSGNFDSNAATLGYWQPNASYSVGEIVAPRLYNGNVYRVVASSGSAGGSEPNWNRAPGGRTDDGNVTWITVKHSIWRFGELGEVAK